MRLLELCYATTGYLGFLVVAPWLVAFLNDVAVPRTAGRGAPPQDVTEAVLVDLALILVIAVQHGLMARRWFRAWWRHWLPESALRATFIWTANVSFVLLFELWRPLPATVWLIDGAFWHGVLYGLAAAGWLLAFGATFALDHLQFFGVRQAWCRWRGEPQPEFRLQVGCCYRVVRHPLFLGLVVGCWSTPHMTAGRLVFALTMTSFVAVAIGLEERRLARELGADWADYRDEVPMLLPLRLRARRGAQDAGAGSASPPRAR